MNKIIIGFTAFLLSSCSGEKPYSEFEKELKREICKCIQIEKSDFESKYSDCMAKTSEQLKNGLDKYPEDSRMSKEEYKKKLPFIIQKTAKIKDCQ